TANDGGVYYIQQVGTFLWWAGMSLDAGLPRDNVWHRGLDSTNVFRGTITTSNLVVGEYADVSRGLTLNSGRLILVIDNPGVVPQLTVVRATGRFRATVLTQTDPLDDTQFQGTPHDIIDRFAAVHKNDGSDLHDNNLKPYRDSTVVYGRVVNSHLEYLNDNQ